MNTPPLHPEWLIKFWLTTPVIRNIDPHLVSAIVLLVIIGIGVYYLRKNKGSQFDDQEMRFQHLLQQKRIAEEQIEVLKEQLAKDEITKEEYDKKIIEYTSFLNKINEDLHQFT